VLQKSLTVDLAHFYLISLDNKALINLSLTFKREALRQLFTVSWCTPSSSASCATQTVNPGNHDTLMVCIGVFIDKVIC
jgi:hypothetical protein